MGLFNRKQGLNAVAAGELLALEQVDDEVFASKMMGNGFAIAYHDGKVYAPFDATVTNIFPTKHAITLTGNKGEVVLIHMGIDTVELKGEAFQIKVALEQKVRKGELLAELDLNVLKAKGKDDVLIVVTPESQQGKLNCDKQLVTPADTVFTF